MKIHIGFTECAKYSTTKHGSKTCSDSSWMKNKHPSTNPEEKMKVKYEYKNYAKANASENIKSNDLTKLSAGVQPIQNGQNEWREATVDKELSNRLYVIQITDGRSFRRNRRRLQTTQPRLQTTQPTRLQTTQPTRLQTTQPTRLQTTQPTSGGVVTADSSCCANCVEPPRPQQWGPDLPFFGHADPLDGWCCCSQKRVMSRPIQVRQL